MQTVEAIGGAQATVILEGQRRFALVVRFPEPARHDRAAISNLLVSAPTGERVPLGQLATVREVDGPAEISHENGSRLIIVEGNVRGRDIGSFVDEVRELFATSAIDLPSGYRVEYGGQFESQQSASERLLVLGGAAIAGVFMILVLAFGRARDALLVMVNLPLALIGGVAGVFLAGGVLSVASMIGFITLFGIATRNGIMLVSHIRQLMDVEGVTDFREAVERGAHERLLPILMTAMAAGLALIPLAMAAGESGSEIQTPMAIVILCGLTTSTLLNMFVVPTLYLRYGHADGSVDAAQAG
jgi:Cu/Ag efflux pump CusA